MKTASTISICCVFLFLVGASVPGVARGQSWATPRVLKTALRARTLTITTEVMIPNPCTTVGKRSTDSTRTTHVVSFWGEPQKGNCVTMIAYDTVNVSLKLRVRGKHSVCIQGRKADGSVTKDSTLTVRVK